MSRNRVHALVGSALVVAVLFAVGYGLGQRHLRTSRQNGAPTVPQTTQKTLPRAQQNRGLELLPMPSVTYPDCTDCCGGVVTDCCGNAINTTLYVTFDNDLAPMGTVTLTYDTGTGKWLGSGIACGGTVDVAFYCDMGMLPFFRMDLTGAAGSTGATNATCSPFLWTLTLPVFSTDPGCTNPNSTATVTQ